MDNLKKLQGGKIIHFDGHKSVLLVVLKANYCQNKEIVMLLMKWQLNDQGRLSATWAKSDQLPEVKKSDKELLDELQLVYNLYSALDAVFMTANH